MRAGRDVFTEIVTGRPVPGPIPLAERIAQANRQHQSNVQTTPKAVVPTNKIVEKTSKTAEVQDKTLTASRDSPGKPDNKPAIPLDQVNAILTPQEEMAMRSLPSTGDIWLDAVPRPINNIVEQKQNKVESPRIPYPPEKLDHPAGSKYPLAIENGKVESQSFAQSFGVPQFLQPATVQPAEVEGIPVEVTKPSAHNGKSLSPVLGTVQDISAKLLKPAGFVSAGLAGVGALVGVVWLYDQVKGFISRKRTKKESSKKRRHVRDWSVQ